MKAEIWSDVVCPWCYIGKRRFERALEQFPHRDDVEVIWRSFELNPDAPRHVEGSNTERLARKYGVTPEQATAMHDRITAVAAQDGLEYHLYQARSGNTFDAHRLLHLAAHHGLQDALQERLMRAYFTEGEAIGQRDTLLRLASQVGLDPEEVHAVLEGDSYADAVRADERRAAAFGISGVPFVALDERYGISGAQPVEVFAEGLQRAWADQHPLTPVGAHGATCEGEACDVPIG